jgi:metal-sulfur cluster biosynthetic enzyme
VTAEAVLEALRGVIDPCCKEKGINVVDMGLVHTVDVTGADARVRLVLTSGWCPFAVDLVGEVRAAVQGVHGVQRADVELTWDVPWSTDRLSDEARRKLRWLPPPRLITDRAAYLSDKFTSQTTQERSS